MVQVQGQEAAELKPGYYSAVCSSVEEDEGEHGKYVRMYFDIEHEGDTVQRTTLFGLKEDERTGNVYFTPKSDLGKLLARCELPVQEICSGEQTFNLAAFAEDRTFEFSVTEHPEEDLTVISKDTIRPAEDSEQATIEEASDE